MSRTLDPELVLKLTADASGMKRALEPLRQELRSAEDEAAELERQLNDIDDTKIKITVFDEEIDRLERKIRDLELKLAKGIKVTPELDVKQLQAEIRAAESTLKSVTKGRKRLQVDIEAKIKPVIDQHELALEEERNRKARMLNSLVQQLNILEEKRIGNLRRLGIAQNIAWDWDRLQDSLHREIDAADAMIALNRKMKEIDEEREDRIRADAEAINAEFDRLRAAEEHRASEIDRLSKLSAESFLQEQRKAVRELNEELDRLKRTRSEKIVMRLDVTQINKDISTVERNIRQLGDDIDRHRPRGMFARLKEDGAGITQWLGGIGSSIAQAGTNASNDFIRLLSRGLLAGGPEVAWAVGALAVMAAAAFVAAFSAAVIGAAGFSALTAGIVGALQDPAIMDATKGFLTQMKNSFVQMSKPFQEPFVRAMQTLAEGTDRFFDKTSAGFQALADTAPQLATGLVTSLEAITPQIDRLLTNAKPLLEFVANEAIPSLVLALGDMFDAIDFGAPGFLGFFKSFVGWIVLVLRFVTGLIYTVGLFANGVQFLITLFMKLMDWVDRVFGKWMGAATPVYLLAKQMGLLNQSTMHAKGSTEEFNSVLRQGTQFLGDSEEATKAAAEQQKILADHMADVNQAAKDQAQKLHELFGNLVGGRLGQEQAINAMKRGLLELGDNLDEESRSLKQNTVAGLKNREALMDQVARINATRDAMIKNNVPIKEATRLWLQNLGALERQAIKLGLNKDAVRALVGQFKTVPKEVEVAIKAAIDTGDYGLVAGQLAILGEDVIPLIKPEWFETQEFVLAMLEAGMDVTKYIKPEWLADPEFTKKLTEAGMPEEKKIKLQIAGKEDTRLLGKLDRLEKGWTSGPVKLDLKTDAAKTVQTEIDKIVATPVSPKITPVLDTASVNAVQFWLNTLKGPPFNYLHVYAQLHHEAFDRAMDVLLRDRTVKVTPFLDQVAVDRVSYTLSTLNQSKAGPSTKGTTGGSQQNFTPGPVPEPRTSVVVNVNDRKWAGLVTATVNGTVATELSRTTRRRSVTR